MESLESWQEKKFRISRQRIQILGPDARRGWPTLSPLFDENEGASI